MVYSWLLALSCSCRSNKDKKTSREDAKTQRKRKHKQIHDLDKHSGDGGLRLLLIAHVGQRKRRNISRKRENAKTQIIKELGYLPPRRFETTSQGTLKPKAPRNPPSRTSRLREKLILQRPVISKNSREDAKTQRKSIRNHRIEHMVMPPSNKPLEE